MIEFEWHPEKARSNLRKHGFKTGTDLLESGDAKLD